MTHSPQIRTAFIIIVLLTVMLAAMATGAWGQATTGQWSTIVGQTVPINPVHAALLRNGKILIVAGSGNCPPSQSGCPSGPPYGQANGSGAAVYDPIAGTFAQLSVSWDMFCESMVMLPDGRVLINGGTLAYDPFKGIQNTSIFDPSNNSFTAVQAMAHGRWYPTSTVLSDGRVMTFSGDNDSTGATNQAVEIYTVNSGWSQEYQASWTPPLYPRMHLLPSGKVVSSGPQSGTHVFDPSNQSWVLNVAFTNYGTTRTYGSSVLLPLTPANGYDPKIMILGGNSPATATTEFIDMGASSPKWVNGPAMSQARIEMNAVLLPNGRILALGGSVNDEDSTTQSLNADLYNIDAIDLTKTNAAVTRSSASANAYARLYHEVALLLPDATVWLAGGNPTRGTYEQRMEIYKPPYLFNSDGSTATRPTISSVPATINWNTSFNVPTPDAANISQVVLIRPGSPTHAFDQEQRLVGLSFTAGSGTLNVTGPPNSNIAPPGYYLLFIINSSGVPAVAKFVQLTSSGTAPAPTVSTISPTSGTTAGGTPVTITGTNFQSGATVSFGGTAATGVTVASSTSITATTPAHAAGAVNVVVTNPDNQSATKASGYTYTTSGGGGGTITFVQVNAATPQSPSASVPVTFSVAQTAGNMNVVAVGWNDTTSTVSSVTDSRGNSYALAIGPTTGTGLRQSIYYAKNIAAGSNTVTVTFNQAAAFVDIEALEYSGLDTSNPLDTAAGAAGSGTTANSGSATTSSANDLIFGAGMTTTHFTTAGTGFTTRIITTPDGDIAEDKTVSSTGSYNATATATSSSWVMQMAAFRASGQGGTNPAPTVSSISPTSGTTAGGTPVTITGTGFLAGATVNLDGNAATGVTVVSGTSITATAPAHAAGAVNVVVTNTDAQSGTKTNGYTYVTSNPAPTVTSISPTSGTTAGGTAVTITGTGFLSGATVTLGGTAATGVTVVNSTSITATTPAHAAGAVNVVVTNTDTQSGTKTSAYTYTASNPAPTVSSISPTSGTTAGGTAVTITGTGFLSGATVTLGGTSATGVTVVSSTSITATSPAHAAGAVNVVVTNTDAQSGTLTSGYTYTTSGGGGGTIAFVQVNAATPQSPSASVPVTFSVAQTAGNTNVVAVGWNDTTSTVSSVTDSRGNSYALAIGPTTGTGLRQSIYYAKNIAAGSNTVTVTFNQAAAFVDIEALEYSGLDTSNPLDTAAGAAGSGTAANSGSATTSSANDLIFGAGMTTTHFTTAGTGFTSRIITTPDGDIAEDKTVSSTGSYNATATATSSSWVMQMVAFRASGQGGTNPAPTVSSISPTSGTTAGGTPVTITGTGFLAGATVNLDGNAATGVTVVSGTSITATTAAHAAGAVNVVVTNTDAQSGTLTNGYTYTASNPAPTVTSISPTSGTTAGGTAVTITGTGFLAGATVKLDGNSATGVTVVNSTSITATAPAHAAGAVNVVVTNTDAQSGTLTNGYTYTTSGGGGTIAFVQVNAANPQSAIASVAVAYTLAQTLGNLNIIAVGWNDTTSTVSSVTDSQGNTYTLAIGPTSGTGLRQSIYYAKNITAGANTVTVTFNQAAAFVDVRALEYSGLDTSNPLDVTAGAVGSGTSPNSGSATTTTASELIFGAGMTTTHFTGAGTGFTSRIITTPDQDIAEDKTVSSTGSYNATAPVTSSNWVMQMATFRVAQ